MAQLTMFSGGPGGVFRLNQITESDFKWLMKGEQKLAGCLFQHKF